MPVVETFYGYIETTKDSLLVMEACRQGLLPRVQRRLQDQERQLIRSGAVFCFDEKESGIKRWTDGLVWSPSRILGNFLIYRELDDQQDERHLDDDLFPQSITSGLTLVSKRQRERSLVGSLRSSYRFKPDGLIKKSMSLVVNGVQQHLVSYYTKEDVLHNIFKTPCDVQQLAAIEISPELIQGQNFRIPFYSDESKPDDKQKDTLASKKTTKVLTDKRRKRRSSYQAKQRHGSLSNTSDQYMLLSTPISHASLAAQVMPLSSTSSPAHFHPAKPPVPTYAPPNSYPHTHLYAYGAPSNLSLMPVSNASTLILHEHPASIESASTTSSPSTIEHSPSHYDTIKPDTNANHTTAAMPAEYDFHHDFSQQLHPQRTTQQHAPQHSQTLHSHATSSHSFHQHHQQPQQQSHQHAMGLEQHLDLPHASCSVGSMYHQSWAPRQFTTGFSIDRMEQNPHQHLFSSTSFHAINHAALTNRTELVGNAFMLDPDALLGSGWNDFEMQM
ncbi:Gti1/Pac2 family-domain-containing protein [Gongronella butleri]|nr:Gti1/Pac2 family-domain-containing protein [Gongronella butleri]